MYDLDGLVNEWHSATSDFDKYDLALKIAKEIEPNGWANMNGSRMDYVGWLVEAFAWADDAGYISEARDVARRIAAWCGPDGWARYRGSNYYRDWWLEY